MALIYQKGIENNLKTSTDFKTDIKKSIELYLKSGDLGNSNALNNLALIYQNGETVVEKDIKKAILYFEKASSMGK